MNVILKPTDFFMHLYNRTFTGNSKEKISDQVAEMMRNQETEDAVDLLKTLNNML